MDDGTYLSCKHDIDEDLGSDDPVRHRRAIARMGTHILTIERKLDDMIEDHTDPATGRPMDVQASYKSLQELIVESRKTRRTAAYIAGVMSVIGVFGGFIFLQLNSEIVESRKVNIEQTAALERVAATQAQVVQRLHSIEQALPRGAK